MSELSVKHFSISRVMVMVYISGSYNESTEGPYYSHLGVGPTEAAIRQLIEQRSASFVLCRRMIVIVIYCFSVYD